MIIFRDRPDLDRIRVDGVEYVRDSENAARYRRVESHEPPLRQMLDDLVRSGFRIDMRTDGAFGTGQVQVNIYRPGTDAFENVELEWGDTVEECVVDLWTLCGAKGWLSPKEVTP